MTNNGDKKTISNVDKAFKRYIPDYAPPQRDRGEDREDEEWTLGAGFTEKLLRQFRQQLELYGSPKEAKRSKDSSKRSNRGPINAR